MRSKVKCGVEEGERDGLVGTRGGLLKLEEEVGERRGRRRQNLSNSME